MREAAQYIRGAYRLMTKTAVMKNTIAGPAAAALKTLSPNQLAFIQSLPKAELHAHLNGSIPLEALQHLAKEYLSRSTPSSSNSISSGDVRAGVKKFSDGISLDKIDDFFVLFPAIYALTATRAALAYATRAVLSEFLDGKSPQCTYLELRSTPKETEEMTREDYLRTVLDEVEKYPRDRAAFIVSLDRRMSMEVMMECVEAVVKLKREGRRVVGIDLCGDPRAGDVNTFEPVFEQVRNAGLGITLHIAEVCPYLHFTVLTLKMSRPPAIQIPKLSNYCRINRNDLVMALF